MLCEEPFSVVGCWKTNTVSATAEQIIIIAHAETYFAVVADGICEFEPSLHSLAGCLHRNSEVESGLSYGRADAQQRLLGSSAKVAISYAVEIQGQQRGQCFQIQHVV